MEIEAIANELMLHDAMHCWFVGSLVKWLRVGCRCVYCDRDMLSSYEMAYHFYAHDHVLPRVRYPELEDADWNQVLCCRFCNDIKNKYDPNADGPVVYERGAHRLSEPQMAELIERTRKYLANIRTPLQQRFAVEVELIRSALKAVAAEQSASAGAS